MLYSPSTSGGRRGGQMKFWLIVFLVLLFSTGETLAPSRASSEITPAQSSPQPLSLDPTKRISQYTHTAWRVQDGVLPVPEAITQTTDGYLWVGTSSGLLRFDGMKFDTWDEISDQHLPGSEIISVLGARDGSLWIGTADGVVQWKDGELIALPPLGGKAHTIIEDHNGVIWIGRMDADDDRGGVCQVVGKDLKFYGQNEGVPFTSVNRL